MSAVDGGPVGGAGAFRARDETIPIARGGRIRATPLVATVLGVLILLSLGVWQVARLQWKTALLARIAALQTAPPEPLDVVLNRLGRAGQQPQGEVDFVRVQMRCATLQQSRTLALYTVLGGQMGFRVITACPIVGGPYRSLLVDRGFVPGEQPPALAPGPAIDAPVVGVLRRPEASNFLTPPNTPAKGDWRHRDVAAMARALGAPSPAPVFLMLESPAATAPGPAPAAIPTDIPNNHLGYALTWFGLAAGLVGVYVAGLRRPGAR